ncbi:MAG: GTPase ObgE [Desulfobacteraceae bacterium]|nr:GTPase ObgE [Desulfobacteraceae bacterium]
MKFVDEAIITVHSGNGGAGCTSFRREKFVEKGGPDGGDGGSGGNVILKVNPAKRTLYDLRRQKLIKAQNGGYGQGKQRHGKNGEDKIIELPLGTTITDFDTNKVLVDLTENQQTFIIAEGGMGGKGNKHFSSSTNRAPRFCQPGIKGIELKIKLELKLLADVGLIGLPNAGKSTLISRISQARPKIADYPFTTLTPNLGMVEPEFGEPFAVADIPGLVEGAHKGTGLGIQFLKHVERTKILLHIIDVSLISPENPLENFNLINNELSKHSTKLAKKKQIVILNKIDLTDSEEKIEIFKNAYNGSDVLSVSAATGKGTKNLITTMAKALNIE